ncbi:uncharacterized protein VTP21DRAFT_2575 [Calcarisporiella thermophila]|uniref:uncharacterized protein n=1 Tax=Calcarisporiella thermophila TaxID=911321 RepID=UPI003744AE72
MRIKMSKVFNVAYLGPGFDFGLDSLVRLWVQAFGRIILVIYRQAKSEEGPLQVILVVCRYQDFYGMLAKIRSSIIQLAKEGKSSYQIADALDIHFTTAAKIVREEVKRRSDLNRRPAGRPRILSKREEKDSDIDDVGELTADTVRRVIQREEVLTRVLPKKPLLSAAHRRRRLEFARKHINWTVEDWKRVMFSDETKLTFTNVTGKQYYYKRKGEPLRSRHIQPTMKQTGNGVMAWGCVTDHGAGNLRRIDGALNAAVTGLTQLIMLPR